MTSYTVVYERDENLWLASVPAVPGCHTQGRTLAQAETRIREALRLWVDDADTARLVSDVRLPRDANRALVACWSARLAFEQARDRARQATWEAVHVLTTDTDLGLRDTGDLVGLSLQRVQQVAAAPPPLLLEGERYSDLLASMFAKGHFVNSAIWAQSVATTIDSREWFTLGAPPAGMSFALPARAQGVVVPFTLTGGVATDKQPSPLVGTQRRRDTDWIDPISVQRADSRVAQQQQKVAP